MDARPVLTQYRFTCHNDRLKTGGLSLEALDLGKIADSPAVWEKVVRRLRTGAMPPPSARRPDQATYDRLTGWLEGELDHQAAAHPNPGRPVVHRLNRAEYANAIRDLLALDVDVASLLPPDDSAYGFDNIADVLGVSPVAAGALPDGGRQISALAVGDPDIGPGSATPTASGRICRRTSTSTACRSARSAACSCRHTFPLDGDYAFQVEALSHQPEHVRGLEYPHQIEFTRRRRADAPRDVRRHRRSRGAVRERRPTRRDAIEARLQRARADQGGPARRWRSRSSRSRRARTRCGCSRFCAARRTRSTGPGGRTSRR